MIDEMPVIKVRALECADTTDELATEEPLEIRLEYGPTFQRETKNISVTMRTPGNDAELAVFLVYRGYNLVFRPGVVGHAYFYLRRRQAEYHTGFIEAGCGTEPA